MSIKHKQQDDMFEIVCLHYEQSFKNQTSIFFLCKFSASLVFCQVVTRLFLCVCLRVWEEVIKNWKNEFFCHIYSTRTPPSLFFFSQKQLVSVTEIIDSPLVPPRWRNFKTNASSKQFFMRSINFWCAFEPQEVSPLSSDIDNSIIASTFRRLLASF